jgi:hypothetical protein
MHWHNTSCETSGSVEYQEWDFQAVGKLIEEDHAKVCPFGDYWRIYDPAKISMSYAWLDLEVSEDLIQVRLKHIQ